MKASVTLAKCPRSKGLYGMRIEEVENDWVRTWAFKISEQKAKHEGYEETKKTGSLRPLPEYPGCPYCGSMIVAQCNCGKLFCWRGEYKANASSVGRAVCPWCGQEGEYNTLNPTIEVEGKGL